MMSTSTLLALAVAQSYGRSDAPPVPRSVTNNAVAAVATATGPAVFSFLGLDSTTAWHGVTNRAFRWTVGAPA